VNGQDALFEWEQHPAEVPDGEAQLLAPQDVPAYTVQAGLATAHGSSPDFQDAGEEG